jgi:hypothetical protein
VSEFFKTAATLHVLEKLGENERTQDRQNRTIDEQNSRIADLEEQLRKAKPSDNSLPAPSGREMDLERRVQELEGIEKILSLPMAEIAKKHPAFKDTYLREQEILAQWILKQKAFSEVAMEYGKALSKTPEQVAAEAEQAQEVIKNGRSKFGNNLSSEAKGVLGYSESKKEEDESLRKKKEEALNKVLRAMDE